MTSEWTIEKIQQLIHNQIEESLTLDYKCPEALGDSRSGKEEITKDVSAFANSAGGTIIYGVCEYKEDDKKHLPEMIRPVNREVWSKERLEQVIGNIMPRIVGLKIHPIPVDNSSSGVIYVVEIPESTTAHQAQDRKYYRRYNFASQPMDDHEVRMVMNRLSSPDLSVTDIVLHLGVEEKLIQTQRNSRDYSRLVLLRFSGLVENMSLKWAEDVRGEIIGWGFGQTTNIGRLVHNSVSFLEPTVNMVFGVPVLSVCKIPIVRPSIAVAAPFEPHEFFQSDMLFPIRISDRFNYGEWFATLYLISKNNPPSLYQIWLEIDQELLNLANHGGSLTLLNERQFRMTRLINEQASVKFETRT